MELERDLHNELHKLAQTLLGFKRGHYTIKVVSEHEFLYKGVETRVTITGQKGECHHLKIKQPPTTSSEPKIPWANCFFNNVHYYTTVLPILKTHGSVPMTPLYYGSSLKNGEEFLILEDLEKSENYTKLGPFPGLSINHVKEAIKMLVYFHCTVQLWKTKNPQQFKSLCGQFRPFLSTKYPYKSDFHKYEKLMKEVLTGIWQLLLRTNHQGGDLRAAFQKLLPNLRKLCANAVKDGKGVEDQQWTTLANCFTYTSNLLFKCHTVTGAVIDVGLEDWSAARLGSPAMDLTLLLFASPSTDLLSNITSLVNEYFTENLLAAELKERHITRFGIFGVIGSLVITIAKAIEDQVELKLELITSHTLSDESFKSNTIPDVKERLVAIIKAAVACNIL